MIGCVQWRAGSTHTHLRSDKSPCNIKAEAVNILLYTSEWSSDYPLCNADINTAFNTHIPLTFRNFHKHSHCEGALCFFPPLLYSILLGGIQKAENKVVRDNSLKVKHIFQLFEPTESYENNLLLLETKL